MEKAIAEFSKSISKQQNIVKKAEDACLAVRARAYSYVHTSSGHVCLRASVLDEACLHVLHLVH